MDLDVLLLSRLQFAFTIGFHILFPALTIGLGLFLVVLEAQWFFRRDELAYRLLRFWAGIFALAFGVGVVSGLVLSYQLGTNWSRFSTFTGNLLGPIISYEVLTAFFLEAGFLGILLFGWHRVSPRVHFFATGMVALGTIISAFWILAGNSWMQTPAGFAVENGRVVATDWWAAVFNPSFPYRFAHMVVACLLSTSLVVGGIAAWYLLKGVHEEFARRAFSLALWMALLAAPAQVVIGDLHGLNTLQHQPVKVAAMEALWETGAPAPFVVFAIPDQQAERNHAEFSIPHLGSLILTHSLDGAVKGLKEVPPRDRPPVAIVFFAFRLMVALGMLFVLVAALGLWLRMRGGLYRARWFQRLCVAVSPLGFVALLAGWTVTEVGRQPWVVYGLQRTADGVSLLPAGSVAATLALFLLAYTVLMTAFLIFFFRMVRRGPDYVAEPPHFQDKARTLYGRA
ncbi:cytochrome ubiquinol oxidase subunit I [Azospirillum sp. TSO22-1]|uniref:cytochrome ubiquinol oxidase subunit I n=1 Tax=Azospirillum sp. TSO22-1 TaxID=716789 RepID=UPI000D617EB9|nr:cytochrome ubiquinol oxidase subunit I [Azospirillum sp. TSO22-1]PWC41160.1 cytochrome D ubiquinol oxidase subunit I [Azospirillum sp. TSO22-1]